MTRNLTAAVLAALLAAAGASWAQNNWQTPSTAFMTGVVSGFLNASGVAVPVTPTAPLPVAPGPFPSGATAITGASGNVANTNAVATLAGVSAKTTYICGLVMSANGATTPAAFSATIVGTITGTLTIAYTATALNAPGSVVTVPFSPCVPASAANTAIVVTLPALGAGNTNATAAAWGYQL